MQAGYLASSLDIAVRFLPCLLTRGEVQVHGDTILQEPRLRKRLAALEDGCQQTWGRIEDMLQTTRSMLSFLANLQA